MKALPSYHELKEALDEEGGQHMNKGSVKSRFQTPAS
jgi:hypothetical protein